MVYRKVKELDRLVILYSLMVFSGRTLKVKFSSVFDLTLLLGTYSQYLHLGNYIEAEYMRAQNNLHYDLTKFIIKNTIIDLLGQCIRSQRHKCSTVLHNNRRKVNNSITGIGHV